MSRRPKHRKQPTLDRANHIYLPVNGGMMYVPSGQKQGVLGQTFYGSKAGIPTGQSALFSPGQTLENQPGVNPSGYPVQWRFPVAYNSFPVDRTLGAPDVPSFQQLRSLAKLYSGIGICERAWFDMVPRMKLKITLKPEYAAAGADEKDYQAEISYFRTWFESPDKMHDQHSWLRMCLREQTQVDELYLYKRKKRGGGLYSLEIVAGDQMKPILDDWGKPPQPPQTAYKQYPWGLPGKEFRTDEMIHYQESPAADNPYGQSRIERIIMLVNQALRKQKKDLSHFTEGNIPQGMMLVPENATWTPDQIDSFEQAWNALLAGNATQQVRMRFTQPGMKYQQFEQYALDPAFDKFILNIAVSVYGMSMQDVAFTEDIHKSSGDSQQNVTYRRTIDPLAIIYASFITECINNDFDPDLHGDMFEASFGGYDEQEDLQTEVAAYSEAIQNAMISPAQAAKKLGMPEIPETGPLFITQGGIVPLANFEIGSKAREAQDAAQIAGLQQTAKPGQQQEEESDGKDTESKLGSTKQSSNKAEQHRQIKASDLYSLDDDEEVEMPEGAEDEPLEEEEDPETAQEDAEWEEEIAQLLKADESEPFTLLERHVPGGHDQKTHGDFAHPAYGVKHDTSPQAKQASQAAASLQPKLQAAETAMQSARDALHQAQATLHNAAPSDKAAARDALHKAEATLHNAAQQARTLREQEKEQRQQAAAKARAEKAEDRAKLQAEKAKAQKLAAQKQSVAANLKAQKAKAHLQKQATAAKAKTARMAASAQKSAHAAATKAAKASVKGAASQQHAALKAAKAQQKAAKMLQSLTNTIGAKAQLYNALSARKISKTWTAQDSADAQAIASDLHSLMNAVNSHLDEGNASSLVQHLTQSIGQLQGQKGITQARAGVLEKLAQKAQQQMSRSVLSDDENYDESEDEEEWFDETDEEGQERERRYTISELLRLLTQQMQEETASQDHTQGTLRSEKEGAVDTGDGRAQHAATINGASEDYKRWRQRAIDDVKTGRAQRGFTSIVIPEGIHKHISIALERCSTPDDVREVFRAAQTNDFHWQDTNAPVQRFLAQLSSQGVKTITWHAYLGACGECTVNDGQTVPLGSRFPSGSYIVPSHANCVCEWTDSQGKRYEWTGVDGEYKQVTHQRSLERSKEPLYLFLDLDGVFSIPNADLPAVEVDGKEAWIIPQVNALLQAIDREKRLKPIWLTHWGRKANAWNDAAGVDHWTVRFPLSENRETEANQLYPDLDRKVLAIQYAMRQEQAASAIWVQDGFAPEEEEWAARSGVRLVNTNEEPLHSLLLSDRANAISEMIGTLVGSEVHM